ncbi:uncharacterized protein M6B38_374475 [Iris pallida]|uniref:Uncharacterized protein n=1 Tax=Iris pallida TaxID=29817 RepID=A0AAX6DNW2_IRIPA|nr:Uncharacterized protein M6B38_236200 [Iris pallida]KAJ6825969.1 uncharacterized protein M6B38_374475 [Iris pallida]
MMASLLRRPLAVGLLFVASALASVFGFSVADPAIVGGRRDLSDKFDSAAENFAPLENGLLKFTPVESGPVPIAPDAKFSLVLAAKRTRRPDILRKFKLYSGGWDITNKHYWVSVGFTGVAGFVLALLWFISFGLALGAHHCCKWRIGTKDNGSYRSQRICLALLLLFTTAASTGCILLSVGQDEFHDELLDTLNFVVNQSDFTVQILRNVTGFLSFAKTIDVEEVYLPLDVQNEIDKLNRDLNSAASTLSEKTYETSGKIKRVVNNVRSALITVAAVMLLLAIIGFLLSILGHKHAMYIFIMSGWLLVAVTFLLCGVFVIINNAVGDTCTSMDEWVRYPQAETALSNILPCVDEQTTNKTLYQSKDVIRQLVNMVNTAIFSIANSNSPPQNSNSFFYNQSGTLMPSLCSPYNSSLLSQQCQPQEVSFDNASMVWQNYTCEVSESGSCMTPGRITPDIYTQLVAAVNVSYALDHYTPLLLSLRDCQFVRETFHSITTMYCPDLDHALRLVNAGMALISAGVMLCLILWVIYKNRPQREEVFVTTQSEVKVSGEKR